MEKCVNISEELRIAESKKVILKRSFDIAHEQANSVLMFTVQWKDLEEHFDLTMKSLEKHSNDVDMKRKLLDERAKEIENKMDDLVLVEKKIEQCNVELELKEGELDLVKIMVEEWSERLDLKREELSLVEKSNEKCRVEQRRLESLIKDCCQQIELKEKELREIRSTIEECEKELVMKEKHVSSIQLLIQDYSEELESKEKFFDEVKKSIIECETKLECEKQELELTQTSIKETSLELRLEVERLESVQWIVRRHENELDSKEEELDSMKEQMKKYFNDIELKEREFNGLRKCIEERSQELTLKEKQLKSVENSIEECKKGFQEKENELISVGKSLMKCTEELELKKKQLYLLENSALEISEKQASNELELDLVQTMTIGYLKQLKEKEKHFDSLKKALEDRLKDLEIKERQFEERDKEFELREKEFGSIQKAVEDRSKNLELKEKKLSNLQVKIEQPESLTGNEGTQQLSVQSCAMNTGRNLQMLLNQHLQKHDLIFGEIFDTIKRARDPALLVLDAMSGFYHSNPREGDVEIDVSIIRRTCILLLEQLSIVTPEINPRVRDEAMKVAGEWKKKMRVTLENSLEVLGFLHLLAAYRLAPSFDGNELESLLDIVAHHRQTPKLRQSLGFADKVPEGRSSLSFLTKHDLSRNEVLGLLHMVPDPAIYVLDLIQGSCSAHWKSQGTGFEEDIVKSYILFLDNLKQVLPKMNPQVKAEAMKLAVEWKTKMGVVTKNSLEVLVFLQLLGTFDLVASFNREEIIELLWTIAQHKQAPGICQALGFRDIVPDFVRNLIGRKKHIEAIRFNCAFKLTNIALTETIIKEYLEDTRRSISDIYREGNNSFDAKGKAIDFEINALRVLTECIEENKLELSFSTEIIKQCIVQLEKKKADRRYSAPVPSSPMIHMQLATRNNYNVTTSAPTDHPVPRPTNQQQHGGMKRSIGTPFPREQPQFQNYHKRPRTEPPTIRAYTPQIPNFINLYSSPAIQSGPGVACSGRHSRGTANMGARLPGRSNVAGNRNLYHFQHKHF